MIDWDTTASQLGYDSPQAMFRDLYVTKHLSIAQIETKLDVSRNVIKEQLLKAGIPKRKPGGPNNAKVVLTQELLDEIRKDGVRAVADRLKLSYTTLYKRLRLRKISVKSLREEASPTPTSE